jgi:hypothetical protein
MFTIDTFCPSHRDDSYGRFGGTCLPLALNKDTIRIEMSVTLTSRPNEMHRLVCSLELLGFRTLSIVRYSKYYRDHNVSETGSVSVFR